MQPIICVSQLSKIYASGHSALRSVDLQIGPGEIFALLGPNGAGKTTLISAICGIVTPTSGVILVGGHDTVKAPRASRVHIGLVPQDLSMDMFESVMDTLKFSRGLFGKRPDRAYLEAVLAEVGLAEKKFAKILSLSGGMKRRVLIAKALAHEPQILFLDEPTAGVDVELRRAMWEVLRSLKRRGVTIILTTNYIEEAEEIADRVGVIDAGEIILVEDKSTLMKMLGKKQLTLYLRDPLPCLPPGLKAEQLELSGDGKVLIYTFDRDVKNDNTRLDLTLLLGRLCEYGIILTDLVTSERSLEEIVVSLIRARP